MNSRRLRADGHAGVGLDKPVNGDRALLACRDGVNGKLGSGVNIAAHKHIRLGGLVGQRVGHGTAATAQLHPGALQQAAPLDALADAQEYMVAFHRDGVVVVIGGGKPALGVVDRHAAFEHHGHRLAVPGQDLLGAPAAVDGGAVLFGFGDLGGGGGHLVPGFQAVHIRRRSAATQTGAHHVNGHIARRPPPQFFR